MLSSNEEIKISTKKIQSILHDAEKSAKAVNLVYVQDNRPGIVRIKKGDSFHYLYEKKRLQDKLVLERIKKLAIPPAWENVWICDLENGHLQATGVDGKKRKQYKYHSLWNALRNHTKFYRLHDFGCAIPNIRQQLKKDLSLPGLPVEKVLAAVVSLMEQTSIRVGNSLYEKLYGSFGLTTLKDQHVKISGDNMKFSFIGKKGIVHNITLKSKRLAKIVKHCRDIPGSELFQYYDQNGNRKAIDSGMINSYLKTISGQDFTAKDFRTWAGSVHAIIAFKDIVASEHAIAIEGKIKSGAASSGELKIEVNDKTKIKTNILAVLDQVADHLGNTRTVCKKYYVHPIIIDLYENNKLYPYFKRFDKIKKEIKNAEISCEEKLLMMILEKEGLHPV